MTHKTSKKLFVFIAGGFFTASPVFFALAQSDGSAPPPADTATPAGVPAPVSAQTASSSVVSPRNVPPTSAPAAASAPAAVVPHGTPKTSPIILTPAALKSQTNSLPVPVVPPPPIAVPQGNNSFPYVLVALAIALVLAPYGLVRTLSQNKPNKNDREGNRCDKIKQLLEQKKSTLEIIAGSISLKQIFIDALAKKIEGKKKELEDEVTTVVLDEVVGEDGGKIIQSAKDAKDTYETLVEDLEQAKRALEYFKNKHRQVSADVGTIESAYHTCLLGNSVFEGTSRLGSGLESFEAAFQQKLYRYTSREKDVFSRGAVLAENLREMSDAGKWLPAPDLPAGEYRFFLTKKGKEEYEKSLFPLHKKYLPDIACEELNPSEMNGVIVYEDEWQAVAKEEEKERLA